MSEWVSELGRGEERKEGERKEEEKREGDFAKYRVKAKQDRKSQMMC